MDKKLNSKKAIFLITLILISSLPFITIQGANGAITFLASADIQTTNAGVSQNAQYTITINNTGSAKMGSANITIPAGYTKLVASSLTLTDYPAGQTWTATVFAQPSKTSNGTIILQGSANGLDHNEIITITFYVTNPATVNEYQWLISGNQNTGEGGQDYQIVVVTFNQLITPAITTQLSIHPNCNLIAGYNLYDTAKLTGTTPDATGTVTYTLYQGLFPNGAEIFQSKVEITSSNLPDVPDSAMSQALNIVGPYYFFAAYSGDEKNSAAIGEPEAFTVKPDILAGFEFAPISNQISGNPFLITITAVDQHGNTISNYAQTNTLSATEGITLTPTAVTFAEGKFSNPITITTTATGVTLTVDDGQSHTGASNAFDITATVPLKLAYTAGTSQTLPAGQISSIITVQLQDSRNNPIIASAPFELFLSTSSSTGIFYQDAKGTTKITTVTIPADQSSASFYYNDTKAGTPTITVSNPTANSAITQLTINPAAKGATKFALSAPESVKAGQNFTTTITAQDSYGNQVTSYAGTVKISTSDYQAILPADFALTAGQGSFSLILKTSGVQIITAMDKVNAAITGSNSINVIANPDMLDRITITPKTATVLIGVSQIFLVEAFDSYQNSLGLVAATIDAPGATITGNSVSASTPGSYTITATLSEKTDSATLTVNQPEPTPTPTPSPTTSPTPTPSPSQTTTSSSTSSSTTTTRTIAPTRYTITFTQQGLPEETEWSITFNGQTKTSQTTTIVFTGIVSGEYSWNAIAIINGEAATRYALSETTPNTINVPTVKEETITYKTQYFLTVNSEIGNPVGQGWYDAGTTAVFNVDQLATDASGAQYSFAGWTGKGTSSYTGQETTQTVTMNNPITETATWEQTTSLYTVAGAACSYSCFYSLRYC